MGSKAEYEAKKAERIRRREEREAQPHYKGSDNEERDALFDLMERFVEAVETIADSMRPNTISGTDDLRS